jgi:hypothetical protein
MMNKGKEPESRGVPDLSLETLQDPLKLAQTRFAWSEILLEASRSGELSRAKNQLKEIAQRIGVPLLLPAEIQAILEYQVSLPPPAPDEIVAQIASATCPQRVGERDVAYEPFCQQVLDDILNFTRAPELSIAKERPKDYPYRILGIFTGVWDILSVTHILALKKAKEELERRRSLFLNGDLDLPIPTKDPEMIRTALFVGVDLDYLVQQKSTPTDPRPKIPFPRRVANLTMVPGVDLVYPVGGILADEIEEFALPIRIADQILEGIHGPRIYSLEERKKVHQLVAEAANETFTLSLFRNLLGLERNPRWLKDYAPLIISVGYPNDPLLAVKRGVFAIIGVDACEVSQSKFGDVHTTDLVQLFRLRKTER